MTTNETELNAILRLPAANSFLREFTIGGIAFDNLTISDVEKVFYVENTTSLYCLFALFSVTFLPYQKPEHRVKENPYARSFFLLLFFVK